MIELSFEWWLLIAVSLILQFIMLLYVSRSIDANNDAVFSFEGMLLAVSVIIMFASFYGSISVLVVVGSMLLTIILRKVMGETHIRNSLLGMVWSLVYVLMTLTDK